MEIKYGCDPEFFAGKVIDGELTVVPAAFFRTQLGLKAIPHKKHPKFFVDRVGHVIHEDGVAFEIAVPPQSNWKDLLADVYSMQSRIGELISKYSDYTDGVFGVPAIKYDWKRWEDIGPELAMCNMFGCDPDLNAFDVGENQSILDVRTHSWRYGGGHIHFSGHPLFSENPRLAIKIFAMTVGLAASAFSPVPDLERERTFLYGKAGKYRVQKYSNGETGVEYRTPSVSWATIGNVSLAERLFYYAGMAINSFMERPKVASKILEEIEFNVNNSILSCDQDDCKSLLSFVESRA